MLLNDPIRAAVMVGSTREGRFGDTVARWFFERAALNTAISIDLVDLAVVNLPAVLSDVPPPEVDAMSSRFADADAFVIVTPEYNHGYPASLKYALGCARKEWMAKPAGADAAAKAMLDQLHWWAWALRDARTNRPYAA